MLGVVYKKMFSALGKNAIKMWALSIAAVALQSVAYPLFCGVPAAAIAIVLMLGTSMAGLYLRFCRKQEVKLVNLFDVFTSWGSIKRVLFGTAWMYLRIFLWALIPFAGIVFAVIKYYELKLTPYILITRPDVGVTEAAELSAKLTDGHKGAMFAADLLPVAAYVSVMLLSLIPFLGIMFWPVMVAVCLVMPLAYGLIGAGFYDELNAPDPAPEQQAQ